MVEKYLILKCVFEKYNFCYCKQVIMQILCLSNKNEMFINAAKNNRIFYAKYIFEKCFIGIGLVYYIVHTAAESGYIEILKYFYRFVPDTRYYILFKASFYGYLDIVKYFYDSTFLEYEHLLNIAELSYKEDIVEYINRYNQK